MIGDLLDGRSAPLWLTLLCVGLLVVAVLGIVASVVAVAPAASLALRQRSDARAQKRQLSSDWDEALIEDVIWHDLMELLAEVTYGTPQPPKPSRRHNVHCATCGRFARRVRMPDGESLDPQLIADCKIHGMVLRESAYPPVDWAHAPIGSAMGVSVYIEPATDLAVDTGVLDIITVDDELSLAEAAKEGAYI